MDQNLAEHGIELHFGELAREYKGTDKVEAVVTDNGEYPVDLVINAIGFLPKQYIRQRALGTIYEWCLLGRPSPTNK